MKRRLNRTARTTVFRGENLNHIAFPLGGIGAGMICLEGTGSLAFPSFRNRPNLNQYSPVFAALHVSGAGTARLLEGIPPLWKASAIPGHETGMPGSILGLPRFSGASFHAEFPFAHVNLTDPSMPVAVKITGWSPFIPGNEDDSSLPVAALEYTFTNTGRSKVEAVFSFHVPNFLRIDDTASVSPVKHGILVGQPPSLRFNDSEAWLEVTTDSPGCRINPAWFRGDPMDPLVIEWHRISSGHCDERKPYTSGASSPGGSISIPFSLTRGETVTHRLQLAWYSPSTGISHESRKLPPGDAPFICDGWRVSRLMPPADIHNIACLSLADHAGWEDVPGSSDRVLIHRMRGTEGIVYLARIIDIPEDCERILHVGHDGSARIFFDGQPVAISTGAVNPIPARRSEARLKLKAGRHEICVALDRMYGRGWGICVSLQRPEQPKSSGGAEQLSATTGPKYSPWYARRFASVNEVSAYWETNYDRLRKESAVFSQCLHNTSMPRELLEQTASNLAILKSPTCLRQADGRFWGYEGCKVSNGVGRGSTTHVWNFAHSLAHLFPAMERSLRETEFLTNQDESGHQHFRTPLPIRPDTHTYSAAADGQLGGIIKLHREWRISGDTKWLASLWPAAMRSLEYCIRTWDPDHTGALTEPYLNTFENDFWGREPMGTGIYLHALRAAADMGAACGTDTSLYETLLKRGLAEIRRTLWKGGRFAQSISLETITVKHTLDLVRQTASGKHSPEALSVLRAGGPKYQYGNGCLATAVMGDWLARCCGVTPVLNSSMVEKHLAAVIRNNFRTGPQSSALPYRPGFAFPQESGLVLCSWPEDDKPQLPFTYCDETWTGVEYMTAAHLIMTGNMDDALRILRAVRQRYDGRHRNPFCEVESGYWSARAMSSYTILLAYSGARYDAVTSVLHIKPVVPGNYSCFMATASGYGTVGVRNGKPFLHVASGTIPVARIEFTPFARQQPPARTGKNPSPRRRLKSRRSSEK